MSDEDSLSEGYFDQGPPKLDDQAMQALLLDAEAREVAKMYMGIASPEKTLQESNKEASKAAAPAEEEEHQEKVFFSDSEEEKEHKRKKQELEGFGDVAVDYTEGGQMALLRDQVSEMEKRKNHLRDKIKAFLASTFDPVIFASISSLLVVEMLAYHQNTFERLHQERTLTAVVSCLTVKELRFALQFKAQVAKLEKRLGSDVNVETQGLVQVAALFAKGVLLAHEKPLRAIIRRETPQEKLESGLTSFEVVSFFGLLLSYLGFKTRCCFLVSFDKLSLDAQYLLDMKGEGKAKREEKKAKRRKKERKARKKQEFVGERGDNDQESVSDSEEASVVSASQKSESATESDKQMFAYEPLGNSRSRLRRHQAPSAGSQRQEEGQEGRHQTPAAG